MNDRVFDPAAVRRATTPSSSPVVKEYTFTDFDGSQCDYTLHADGSVTIVAERAAGEANPIDGQWYSLNERKLPGSPCYGCRRGLRRSYHILCDGVSQFHLVRRGLTIDCTGLDYRISLLFEELP